MVHTQIRPQEIWADLRGLTVGVTLGGTTRTACSGTLGSIKSCLLFGWTMSGRLDCRSRHYPGYS